MPSADYEMRVWTPGIYEPAWPVGPIYVKVDSFGGELWRWQYTACNGDQITATHYPADYCTLRGTDLVCPVHD